MLLDSLLIRILKVQRINLFVVPHEAILFRNRLYQPRSGQRMRNAGSVSGFTILTHLTFS
jgi:hypothetical protein